MCNFLQFVHNISINDYENFYISSSENQYIQHLRFRVTRLKIFQLQTKTKKKNRISWYSWNKFSFNIVFSRNILLKMFTWINYGDKVFSFYGSTSRSILLILTYSVLQFMFHSPILIRAINFNIWILADNCNRFFTNTLRCCGYTSDNYCKNKQ